MERMSSKYDRPTIWWGDGGCCRRALPDWALGGVSSVLIHASCNLDAVTIHDSRRVSSRVRVFWSTDAHVIRLGPKTRKLHMKDSCGRDISRWYYRDRPL